jgi:two-component system sensor histidine kinase HydH
MSGDLEDPYTERGTCAAASLGRWRGPGPLGEPPMLTRILLFRIAGPSLLVSLLFLASCVTAAVYLHHRQSASLRVLDESLMSRRVAADLLRALEHLPGDRPEAQREQVAGLLGLFRRYADQPDEVRLAGRIEDGFARYRRLTGGEALAVLEGDLIPAGRELERFNTAAVERSEAVLQRTVAWTAWGLAGVGLAGSLTGLTLGYVVARGLGEAVLRAEELAEVGQVAAGMAHELRNPLTAIKMLVQANREDAESRDLPAEDLRVIEQEIRRMEDRLNVFIDFARPPRPERRLVDLKGVVEQTLALVSGRARKQRVTLRFEPPAAPAEVEADGEQIRQLLVNLALNALDVMPRGGVLEVGVSPEADGQVEVSVVDTGPGIPPRHLPRLYEPFFTSKETGLGLGLAVSQRIAHDHGGTLLAANRPQGGARFVLRLPARGDGRGGRGG